MYRHVVCFALLALSCNSNFGTLAVSRNKTLTAKTCEASIKPIGCITSISFSGLDLIVGQKLESSSPKVTGAEAVSFKISPDLPAGLTFDPKTGSISGTPTAALNSSLFEISAIGELNSTSTNFNIAVTAMINLDVGFVTSTSFKFKNGFSETPECALDGVKKDLTKAGDWYKIPGLTAGTTYSLTCKTSKQMANGRKVRTLQQSETILDVTGFTQDGVTRIPSDCFAHTRMIKYNPSNGRIEAVGLTAGSLTNSSCYASYNGVKWEHLAINSLTAPDWGAYQLGTGLSFLPNGTMYFLEGYANTPGVEYKLRLYRCVTDCQKISSWKNFTFASPTSNLGYNLYITPDGSKMIASQYSGVTSDSIVNYCQPSSSIDCMSQSHWTTVSPSTGLAMNGRTFPYIDSLGNMWVFVNSGTETLLYCSAQSNCAVSGNWTKGKFSTGANNHSIGQAYFEETNGTLQILTHHAPANQWANGTCVLSSGTCGTLSGGIYTGFGAVNNAFVSNDVTGFGKMDGGYTVFYRDNAGTSQTKYIKCVGDFAACKAYPTGWTTGSLMPDGLDHIWDTYQARNVFIDDNGKPGAWLQNGTTASAVLHFY